MAKPKWTVVGADADQLDDGQLGPLAEAIALADVMNIIAVDKLGAYDDTLPTLTRMLCERLNSVKTIVRRMEEVSHG